MSSKPTPPSANSGGLPLIPAAALKMAKLTRAIRQEVEDIAEARKAIEAQHILKDDKGQPIPVDAAKPDLGSKVKDQAAFASAIAAMFKGEVDIKADPLTMADFGEEKVSSDLLVGLHFAIA